MKVGPQQSNHILEDSLKEWIENIIIYAGIGLVTLGGILFILILQPWFWLAVIAITFIIYIF